MRLGNNLIQFVQPRLEVEEAEWERDGVGEVHFKPLYWSSAPPEPGAKPRNYYARLPDSADYWLIRVDPDYDYSEINVEWFGPLPEPGMPRRVRRP